MRVVLHGILAFDLYRTPKAGDLGPEESVSDLGHANLKSRDGLFGTARSRGCPDLTV